MLFKTRDVDEVTVAFVDPVLLLDLLFLLHRLANLRLLLSVKQDLAKLQPALGLVILGEGTLWVLSFLLFCGLEVIRQDHDQRLNLDCLNVGGFAVSWLVFAWK